jgi:hypothetical protein
VRCLHADLTDADVGVVDENDASDNGHCYDENSDVEPSHEESVMDATTTRAPRVYIAALLGALNESVAALDSDSLVDKKLKNVSSYRDDEGYPISRFTFEIVHICANSKCRDDGMSH